MIDALIYLISSLAAVFLFGVFVNVTAYAIARCIKDLL